MPSPQTRRPLPRLGRHALATLTMILGSALVFGFLVAMNAYSTPPQPQDKEAGTAFSVKKPPKKKKRKRLRPKPRRSTRTRSARPAPPNLAAGLSSVSLNMPDFALGDTGQGTQELLGNSNKRLVMDERSVDEPPKALNRVAPSAYPEQARKKGIEGFVKMNVLIGTDGNVQRVKVLEAQPAGVFDPVAIATIRRWRFEPAVYQAEHVRVWATQTMRFKLN